MKYVFIEKHQAEFSIKAMCRVLRVARSGWYAWMNRRAVMSARQQFRQNCDSAAGQDHVKYVFCTEKSAHIAQKNKR